MFFTFVSNCSLSSSFYTANNDPVVLIAVVVVVGTDLSNLLFVGDGSLLDRRVCMCVVCVVSLSCWWSVVPSPCGLSGCCWLSGMVRYSLRWKVTGRTFPSERSDPLCSLFCCCSARTDVSGKLGVRPDSR